MNRESFAENYPVPEDFQSDGCTCAPDGLFGHDYRPACRVHDFLRAYAVVSVRDADRYFHRALLDCGAPRWVARLYWFWVKLARPWFARTRELPEAWDDYQFAWQMTVAEDLE